MITKITSEQKAKIPEYLNYWRSIGLRTETIDRDLAKESINFMYEKILKISKPKYYIFLDSPMACQLFLNDSNQLDNQLDNQLWNQLRNQLDNQLWNQLGSQLGSQLRNQLENQLWNQLGSQKMSFVYESKTNWTQSYYWHYFFILNEILPEKKKDFDLFLKYVEYSKYYHHVYLSPEIAVFSDFPKVISLDSEGRLDNENGLALEYRDGYGFYASHGKIATTPLELELL